MMKKSFLASILRISNEKEEEAFLRIHSSTTPIIACKPLSLTGRTLALREFRRLLRSSLMMRLWWSDRWSQNRLHAKGLSIEREDSPRRFTEGTCREKDSRSNHLQQQLRRAETLSLREWKAFFARKSIPKIVFNNPKIQIPKRSDKTSHYVLFWVPNIGNKCVQDAGWRSPGVRSLICTNPGELS